MKTRYVLYSPEWGVYLGTFWGMGFWTKLDPIGQDAAITFATAEEATRWAATWDRPVKDVRPTSVQIEDEGTRRSPSASPRDFLRGTPTP